MQMSPQHRAAGSGDVHTAGTGRGRNHVLVWLVASAVFLLAKGGIHLYLSFHGVGGVLGVLFVLNAIGALVLAIAMVVLRRRLLLVASLLSLLFMAGTLLALVLALTVGLFGIREILDFQLVQTTLVVESIGIVVLATTTALVSGWAAPPDLERWPTPRTEAPRGVDPGMFSGFVASITTFPARATTAAAQSRTDHITFAGG
jgi:hypothetical protein